MQRKNTKKISLWPRNSPFQQDLLSLYGFTEGTSHRDALYQYYKFSYNLIQLFKNTEKWEEELDLRGNKVVKPPDIPLASGKLAVC